MTVRLDMPASEYHADPALGSSSIRLLLKSAAHYREARDNGTPETDAMQLGTLVHECVLEPKKWAKRVVVPKLDRRTKDGKRLAELWEIKIANEGLTVMDEAHKALAEAMAASIQRHKLASHLLNSAEVREASYFWDDDGVPCKARVDAGVRRAVIVDLKTTQDASAEGFIKSIVNYLYHVQAAHYTAGYKAITGNVASFAWIAVEKTRPYAVAVYEADAEMLEIGHLLRNRALATYRECSASGVWPAYGDGHRVIRLPGWYANEFREEVA